MSLVMAYLDGISLVMAYLDDMSLVMAYLDGISLVMAYLDGISLVMAYLGGMSQARLDDVRCQSSFFSFRKNDRRLSPTAYTCTYSLMGQSVHCVQIVSSYSP